MLSWETFATGLVTLTRDRSARLRLRTHLLTLQVFFKAARLSLAIPFGEGERRNGRGRWGRRIGEEAEREAGMNSLKVHGKKKKAYDTLIPKAKKAETLHKLLFTASSYTSSHCAKTLAFQGLCFLHGFPA